MFKTLNSLFRGLSAEAEEELQDRFSVTLIDQKLREAEASQIAAKHNLAALIQRQRTETAQLEQIQAKHADMIERAQQALAAGNQALAEEAAQAIVQMENEMVHRRQTLELIERRVLRLRQAINTSHRRLIDLKQGAVAARAAKREAESQLRLSRGVTNSTAFDEAEALIARVLGSEDPFERADIIW